jgi:hypothetical protein
MQIAYCANCGKLTGHKRALGAGTVLGAVVTGGASLLAVPAYGKRCIVCGLTVGEATSLASPIPQEPRTQWPPAVQLRTPQEQPVVQASARDQAIGWLVLVAVLLIVSFLLTIGHH